MATISAKGPSTPSIDDYFIRLWNANAGFLFVLFLVFAFVIVFRSGDRIAARFEKFFNTIFGSPFAPKKTDYNTANIPSGWTPNNLAAELYAIINPGWFGGFYGSQKCEIASRVMELNDDQFIWFANYYNRKYGTEEQNTLKRQLEDEWDGCSVFSTNHIERVINRYIQLVK